MISGAPLASCGRKAKVDGIGRSFFGSTETLVRWALSSGPETIASVGLGSYGSPVGLSFAHLSKVILAPIAPSKGAAH